MNGAALWLKENVLTEGDLFFDSLLREISAAGTSVSLETFIFEDSPLGTRVLEALVAAARRGVRVRLLVDGLGSAAWVRKRGVALSEAHFELRVFHPLPVFLLPWFSFGANGLAHFFALLRRINRRDHRKVCVIDVKTAWVGSFNISSNHLGGARVADHTNRLQGRPYGWRDTAARVEGRAVGDLQRGFDDIWRRAWGLSAARFHAPRPAFLRAPSALSVAKSSWVASSLVRLNTRRQARLVLYRDLLFRITKARQRIWITNAYFVPDGALVRALSAAARSGLDVRILVPAVSDVPFMPFVSAAFYFALLRAGVRIFEFTDGVLHAKTMLIDSWVSVGSTNLNHRSLLHDLEADVVLLQPDSIVHMRQIFENDLAHAREVSMRDWRERPWWQKLIGRAALLWKEMI